MASGYDLKEGKYDPSLKSTQEMKDTMASFFQKKSKKESTYKYAMLKSVMDCLVYAKGKTYTIPFDLLFCRFTEIYWVLVFKYQIPQKAPSAKTPKTLAEKIIWEMKDKYKLSRKTQYADLPDNLKRELIMQMKKKCSRYVFGALYTETNQLLYSFSKEKEWIKVNPQFLSYYRKHERVIQLQNYQAWSQFYVDVVIAEKDVAYYQRLLKREFGDNTVTVVLSSSMTEKKNHQNKKQANYDGDFSYDTRIATKVRDIMSQYPDLGLYLAQISEKAEESRELIKPILDNSFWCRKEGNRYYYINVSDLDIVNEAIFSEDDEEKTDEIDDLSAEEDAENIRLLYDPEQLIKKLKRDKEIQNSEKTGTKIDTGLKMDVAEISGPVVNKESRKRVWDREEVIVLVVEYFRTKDMPNEDIIEAQEKVSRFLRHREEVITGEPVDEKFRNYAGIRMQSGRIRCLDPETEYTGMKGTKLQQEIVQEYIANPQAIIDEANKIFDAYNTAH